MDAIENRALIPGLTETDCRSIITILERFTEIRQAIVFGSRAKGTYKNGSDIDLAVKGNDINNQIVSKIRYVLNEEIPLPWFFDVVCYEKINNQELKEHIDRVGIVFYKQMSEK